MDKNIKERVAFITKHCDLLGYVKSYFSVDYSDFFFQLCKDCQARYIGHLKARNVMHCSLIDEFYYVLKNLGIS